MIIFWDLRFGFVYEIKGRSRVPKQQTGCCSDPVFRNPYKEEQLLCKSQGALTPGSGRSSSTIASSEFRKPAKLWKMDKPGAWPLSVCPLKFFLRIRMDLDESGLSSEEAFGWWEENETEAGPLLAMEVWELGTSSNHAGGCSIAMSVWVSEGRRKRGRICWWFLTILGDLLFLLAIACPKVIAAIDILNWMESHKIPWFQSPPISWVLWLPWPINIFRPSNHRYGDSDCAWPSREALEVTPLVENFTKTLCLNQLNSGC